MFKPLIVIKLGGHALEDASACLKNMQTIAKLKHRDYNIVLVHGGGPQIDTMLSQMQIQPSFQNGLRVTDQATLEVVEMILSAKINKQLVAELAREEINAVGLSGRDGNMLEAVVKNPSLGLVGQIIKVETSLLTCLLENDFLPVISPVGANCEHRPLNINGDSAAAAIANALKARLFILISNVPGVLDAKKEQFAKLSRAEIEDLTKSGVISGGMLPKVEACLDALTENPHSQALIADNLDLESLLELLSDNGTSPNYGTTIIA